MDSRNPKVPRQESQDDPGRDPDRRSWFRVPGPGSARQQGGGLQLCTCGRCWLLHGMQLLLNKFIPWHFQTRGLDWQKDKAKAVPCQPCPQVVRHKLRHVIRQHNSLVKNHSVCVQVLSLFIHLFIVIIFHTWRFMILKIIQIPINLFS